MSAFLNKRHRSLQRYLFLLTPGLDIKRWLLLGVVGLGLLALGVAFTLPIPLKDPFWTVVYRITLVGYSPWIRGAVFISAGALLLALGAWRLYVSVTHLPISRRQTPASVIHDLYVHRLLRAGPRVVAIGGGTGLSTLLRGMKQFTSNITAVVSVADDGGSSGRLRSELGILPPGDIRNCLVALADSETLMNQLMNYRFPVESSLHGHSLGNLLIAALSDIAGSFETGVERAASILAIRGRVIPATLSAQVLTGETVSGRTLVGESQVGRAREPIRRVYLASEEVIAYPDAVQAIQEADLVVLGPGSLFTSIIPHLLVPGIRDAIHRAQGLKVYVCNVAEQPGETAGFSATDHVSTMVRYSGEGVIDAALVNNNLDPMLATAHPIRLVSMGASTPNPVPLAFADVIDWEMPTRHDSAKLASAIAQIYREKRGDRRPMLQAWQVRSV